MAAINDISAVVLVMSSRGQARLLFGFEPADWLFLIGGVALLAGFAAVFVL